MMPFRNKSCVDGTDHYFLDTTSIVWDFIVIHRDNRGATYKKEEHDDRVLLDVSKIIPYISWNYGVLLVGRFFASATLFEGNFHILNVRLHIFVYAVSVSLSSI